MAHVGEEFRLAAVGRLGRIARQQHGLFGLLLRGNILRKDQGGRSILEHHARGGLEDRHGKTLLVQADGFEHLFAGRVRLDQRFVGGQCRLRWRGNHGGPGQTVQIVFERVAMQPAVARIRVDEAAVAQDGDGHGRIFDQGAKACFAVGHGLHGLALRFLFRLPGGLLPAPPLAPEQQAGPGQRQRGKAEDVGQRLAPQRGGDGRFFAAQADDDGTVHVQRGWRDGCHGHDAGCSGAGNLDAAQDPSLIAAVAKAPQEAAGHVHIAAIRGPGGIVQELPPVAMHDDGPDVGGIHGGAELGREVFGVEGGQHHAGKAALLVLHHARRRDDQVALEGMERRRDVQHARIGGVARRLEVAAARKILVGQFRDIGGDRLALRIDDQHGAHARHGVDQRGQPPRQGLRGTRRGAIAKIVADHAVEHQVGRCQIDFDIFCQQRRQHAQAFTLGRVVPRGFGQVRIGKGGSHEEQAEE